MTYNKETRELTITLPEGDWYARNDLIQALDELQNMTLEDRSEYFVYIRTNRHTGCRAQMLSAEMALFIAYILKLDVDSRFHKSPFEMMQDPTFAKKALKGIEKLTQEMEKIESKRNIYGDNYDPDDDDQ